MMICGFTRCFLAESKNWLLIGLCHRDGGSNTTTRSIKIGKRADLLVVSERMELPVVARTIVAGEVAYAAGGVR